MNPCPLVGVVAVACGAALGAWSRWALGSALDAWAPSLPAGTLAANLIGAYLIGVAIGVLDRREDLSPAWRLFAITGFLGGLTTFSTFSAEVVADLRAGHTAAACVEIVVHVGGSVALTLAGLATVGRRARRRADAEALERLAGE